MNPAPFYKSGRFWLGVIAVSMLFALGLLGHAEEVAWPIAAVASGASLSSFLKPQKKVSK